MAQSFIQVPPDSTGKKVDTWVTSTAAQHRETAVIGDPSVDANVLPVKAASTAAVAADCAIPVCLSPNNAPIKSVGAGSFAPATVTVSGASGAPTLLAAARTGAPGTGRVSASFINGANPITLCTASNSTTGGLIPAGVPWTMEVTAAVYAFQTVGNSIVTLWETF